MNDNETKITKKEKIAFERAIKLIGLENKYEIENLYNLIDKFTEDMTMILKEPLDGDQVKALVDFIRIQLDLKEGNW